MTRWENLRGGPNKPVVPTAHDRPDVDPLNSLRRQTGRPLDLKATALRSTIGKKNWAMDNENGVLSD
jgi:hypothetical protein